MRTHKTETFLLISFVLLIAVVGTVAQTQKTAYASIPFEFWIGGTRFPAGEYVIEHLETMSYFYIRQTDGRRGQDVYTLPLDYIPAKEGQCKLIFEVRDGGHYLYGGWGPLGDRVLTAKSTEPAPSGADRAEIPIAFR